MTTPGSSPTPPESFKNSGDKYLLLAKVLLLLAIVGGISSGVLFAPDSCYEASFGGQRCETEVAAGIGIGLAVFISGLFSVVVFHGIGRILKAQAWIGWRLNQVGLNPETPPTSGVEGSPEITGIWDGDRMAIPQARLDTVKRWVKIGLILWVGIIAALAVFSIVVG